MNWMHFELSARKSMLLALIPILMVAAVGCNDSTTDPGPGGTPVDVSTPDSLLVSLERVLEAMDAATYAELLNDSDRDVAASFEFYFTPLDLGDYPYQFSLSEELSCMGHLLGGDPGESAEGEPIPAVSSVDINFFPHGDAWESIDGLVVEGDIAPPGAVRRRFETSYLLTLDAVIGGGGINAFDIQDQMDLYLVPAGDGYRIWKQFDIISRGTADMSWSELKWFYATDYEAPVFEYLPYDSPDNLVENLVRAWENLDIDEYRDHILYDGLLPATDGATYEPFYFYYDPDGEQGGQTFPDLDLYGTEVQILGKLFSGQMGQDHLGNPIPGVDMLRWSVSGESAWDGPPGDTVEDHPYPEGTLRSFYGTDLLFNLKTTIGDSNIDAWWVDDRMLLHVIPVEVGGATEYRLWKWRDLIISHRSTEDVSLSAIKMLYREVPR